MKRPPTRDYSTDSHPFAGGFKRRKGKAKGPIPRLVKQAVERLLPRKMA